MTVSWLSDLPLPLRRPADLDRLAAAMTDHERSARFHQGGSKLSLRGMQRLDRLLDHPSRARPVIHVAGSKGKGSVCLFLEGLLREHGLTPGLYLSPHVERWTERIRIGGRCCRFTDMAAWVEEVLTRAAKAGLSRPTFFESLTAAGFLGLVRSAVDVAVIEVGIGGRLDCTNVVRPDCTVLTSVECEHQAVLGRRLCDIAHEKTGIFKRGVPAVSGIVGSHSVAGQVVERATEAGAPLLVRGRDFLIRRGGGGFTLRLPDHSRLRLPEPAGGPHGVTNAALAIVALDRLARRRPKLGLELQEDRIGRALERTVLSGRGEQVGENPAVYRDGAHTPRSLGDVVRWVAGRHPGPPPVVVLGLNQDKRLRGCVAAIRPHASHLIATRVPGGRGQAPADIVREARRQGLRAEALGDLDEALAEARRRAGRGGSIVVAGSFWLVGMVPRLARAAQEP